MVQKEEISSPITNKKLSPNGETVKRGFMCRNKDIEFVIKN